MVAVKMKINMMEILKRVVQTRRMSVRNVVATGIMNVNAMGMTKYVLCAVMKFKTVFVMTVMTMMITKGVNVQMIKIKVTVIEMIAK